MMVQMHCSQEFIGSLSFKLGIVCSYRLGSSTYTGLEQTGLGPWSPGGNIAADKPLHSAWLIFRSQTLRKCMQKKCRMTGAQDCWMADCPWWFADVCTWSSRCNEHLKGKILQILEDLFHFAAFSVLSNMGIALNMLPMAWLSWLLCDNWDSQITVWFLTQCGLSATNHVYRILCFGAIFCGFSWRHTIARCIGWGTQEMKQDWETRSGLPSKFSHIWTLH